MNNYGIGDPTKYEVDWPTEPEAVFILETGEYLLPEECAVILNIQERKIEALNIALEEASKTIDRLIRE